MKFTWRNKVAYVLLAAAVVSYALSIPLLAQQLELARSPEASDAFYNSIAAFVSWLSAPIYLIGWAAVIEYLSRIAEALQRRNGAV